MNTLWIILLTICFAIGVSSFFSSVFDKRKKRKQQETDIEGWLHYVANFH